MADFTESLPSMNTFSMNLKLCCETPDLKLLLPFLSDGQAASDLEEKLDVLARLRRECVSPSMDFSGIERIMKYFGQIHLLSLRLDMNKGQPAYVKFRWNDTNFFGKITGSVHLERYCMLFNMAAIHFSLGSAASRKETDEDWKKSCQHFQCAAGILQWMKQNIKSENKSETALIQDESVDYHYQVALAHAQEQLLFKAVRDKRKLNLLAKLSQNVFERYQTVLEDCQQMEFGEMGLKKHPEWDEFVFIRTSFYGALTWAFVGTSYESGSEYGNAIYCFEKAATFVNSLPKTDKKKQLDEAPAIDFIRASVTRKLDILKRDNSFIYHEKVPASLPDVTSQCLVKPFPFVPYDVKVVGADLFPSSMPIDAVSATSLYSEKKDNLLREVTGQMEELNEELKAFEDNLDLKNLPHLDGFGVSLQDAPLPEELVERCARLSLKPSTPTELADSLQELTKMVREIDENLNLISEKLESESGRNSQLMEEHSISRDTSKINEIAEEYEKLRNDHVGSNDKCKQLRQIVNENISNLRRLSETPLPELKQHLIKNEDGEVEEVDKEPLQTMKKLIDKIGEMKNQRVKLFDQLKAALDADDITVLLSATKDSMNQDKIFERELKKHDSTVALLKQNFEAQKNICNAVEEAYAQYALVRRKLYELTTKRERKANDLIFSFDSCVQMRDKIEEFSEFYKELNQNVSDLRHKLLILCKSEQIERERLEAAKKARPQRPTAKKPNLPSTPTTSSAAPDAPKGGAASMLDPEFLKTLTPDERELLETLSPEELQQLSGTMSSEAPVPSPLPNMTRPQAKPCMPLKTQFHMDVPQSFNPGFAGAPFASSQPVQNSGLYNNALLDTLTPDERRLLLGEDAPVVSNNPSNSSMASSRNAVASRSTVMGAAYHGATQQVDNQNPVLQQQMQVVQKPLAQNISAAAAVNTAGHQNIHSIAPVGQQWPVNYHGTNATNPASSSVFQTNQNTYQPVVQDLSKGPQVVSNGHQNRNNQFGQYNATGNSSSLPTTHNQYQYSPQSSLNYATNPSVTAQSQFLTPHSHNQFMPVQNISNYGFAPERQHVPQMWNNQGSAIAAAPRSLTPNSNGPSSLEMSSEHVAILEQMKQQQTFLMQQLEVQNKRQAELEKQLADQRMSHQMELQRQEKAKEREHEKVMLEQQVLLQEQINRQKALEKQLEEQNLQQQQILSQVWNVASLTQNYQQQLDQLRNRAISEKQPNTQNVSESVQLPETNVAATTFRNQPTSLPQDYTANQNYSPVPQNLHSNAPVSVQTAAPMYGNYQGMHSIPNSLSSSQSEPTRASVQSVPTTMDDSSKEVSQYVAMYDPKKPMDPKVLSALMKQQSQQKPLVFPNSQQQQGAQMTQNVSQNYSGVQMNSNITNNQPPTSHSNVPISYQQSVVATDSQSINGNNLANNVVQNASTSNISMQHPNAQANWYYGHGVASHNSEKRSNSVDQSLGHCESPVLKNHEVKHNPTVDSSPTHNSRAFNSSLQPNQPINQVKVDPTPVLQPNATVVSSNTSKSTDSEGGVVEPSVKVEAGDINGARRSESQSPSPAIIEQHMPVVMSSNSVPADDNKSVSDQETRLPPSNEVSQVINSIIKRSPVVRNSPLRKSSVLPNADQFISKLVSDVEKLEKHLANIHKRTLNGPTILEREWEDLENKFVKNCSTCKEKSDLKLAENVPSLNSAVRTSECFVGNAVVRSVYPDQIGGSKMVVVDVDMEFGLVPRFLLLGSESSDSDESMKLFWEMVSESDISLIVSFSGRNQPCPYMPTMQGVNVSIGKDLFLRLQNTSISQYWLQRTVNLFSPAQNTNRSVTHLQFLEWPSVDCCENSSASELFPKHAPFLSFVRTVRHFYSLQSNYNQPVLLLCRDGITQSGILMLLLKCMQCIDHGFGMTDVSTEINAIRHFHQAIVTSPNQMFFLYICYLHYIQQFLSTTKANQTCSYQVINSPSPYGLPSLQPISTKTTFSEETNSNSMQANNDSEDKSGNAANGVRDLRALMSADNFSVGSRSGSPKGPKRHNFDDATFKIGQESNPNDPFSSLDPLWKMK